jgi:predicted nuclease of predicted toxin-antitoxin system
MAIKFYTDEHIHPAVIKNLRQKGVDVLTSQETNMLGVEDKSHLEFSTAQGRVLVTHDKDFLHLQKILKHSGIVHVQSKNSIRQITEGLILIAQVLTEEDMKNHVEYL